MAIGLGVLWLHLLFSSCSHVLTMPDTGARHFVGAMHPGTFLQAFMQPTELDVRIPQADYSRVPSRGSVPDMCRVLVQIIEKAKVCPSVRFFRTRTARQWLKEVTITRRTFDSDESLEDESEVGEYKFKYGHTPALAARTRPRPRKGTKRKTDIVEAYDYATALLDVEVHHRSQADPFTDPSDATNHGPSTTTSPTYHAQSEIRPTPARPPCSRPPMDQPEQSKSTHHHPESRGSPTRQKPISGSSSSSAYYQLFENPSHESSTFRATLVSHAAAQFTRRHRVFFFQLVILGRWARFIRWDRSGAICTERKNKVPHIPNVLYGGDVYDGRLKPQETLTQLYAEDEDDWRITNNVHERYVHHRIVQDIAYPLESALDVREFVQAIHDALQAIHKAHTTGLLHRDLSIGNIMIDLSGRGVLNDWDHAGSVEEPARGVGTWRFMSISLLSKPDKLHDITDDLESVYWVLLYGALKMFASADQDLPLNVFDWHGIDRDGRRIGGRFKQAWIYNSDRLFALGLTSTALQELILESQRCWFMFYNVRDDLMSLDGLGDLRDRMTKTLEQAPDPSFWIDKYAAALRSLEEQEHTPTRPSTSSEDHRERGTRSAQQLGAADAPTARVVPSESAAGGRNLKSVEQRARKQDASTTRKSDIKPTSSLSRKRRAEDLNPNSLGVVPLLPSKRRRVQS
ncbi:hypothetical protein PHLGIDRAFT_12541 [Phlebiopsis gigantea 11061_1 CR5-6]|uniref:Fungal-type protein kinase domain-containing protein n=1 Tax=Phlebiopsis gigantea (strain 11061_1 CR5-6) TaxID=745531 RepID=A0A0C3S9R3_PHLG1|nr:hypothetical protein PHLGIDRAFT_12541 [Phlebiopsis gigantea 11061_1 CR5-6]